LDGVKDTVDTEDAIIPRDPLFNWLLVHWVLLIRNSNYKPDCQATQLSF
jgi:hypothetical protein